MYIVSVAVANRYGFKERSKAVTYYSTSAHEAII